jgi:DNA-directed RNA polymerase specialized sigma24 family protein
VTLSTLTLREAAVEEARGIARRLAHQYRGTGALDEEELFGAACLGVAQSMRKWDESRPIGPFATTFIKRRIGDYQREILGRGAGGHGIAVGVDEVDRLPVSCRRSPTAGATPPWVGRPLTAAQRRALIALAETGDQHKDLAVRLGLNHRAVQKQLDRCKLKLGVHSNGQLIVAAWRSGMVQVDPRWDAFTAKLRELQAIVEG